jgi:hypothetical protein
LLTIKADAAKKGKRGWTKSHAKLLGDLKNDEKRRKLWANQFGQLRAEERPGQDSVKAFVEKARKTDMDARARHAAIARKVRAFVPQLSVLRCFIQVSEPAKVDSVKEALRKAGGQHVASLALANAVAVDNPTCLGQRLSWQCALRGLYIFSVDRLVRGQGSHLKLLEQISRPRSVWISPSFKTQHPHLAEIVRSCAQAQGSRWRVLEAREDFVQKCRVYRSDRRFQAIALSTVQECKAWPGECRAWKGKVDTMFNVTTFFDKFWEVETQSFDPFGV